MDRAKDHCDASKWENFTSIQKQPAVDFQLMCQCEYRPPDHCSSNVK